LTVLVDLNVALSMVAIAPVAVLRGLQRYPAANPVIGGSALATALLTVLALALGTGILGVAAATATASLVAYAGSLIVVRRVAPEIMSVPLRAERSRTLRLLRRSGTASPPAAPTRRLQPPHRSTDE